MKKLSIYIIIVLGLFFSSCEKTLKTPKSQAKPLIVINSVLETNKPISVFINKSTVIFDKEINNAYNVDNIDLKIYENDVFIGKPQKIDQNLAYEPYNKKIKYSDLYKLDHIVKEGATYSISADCKNFKTAEARTKIPSPVSFKVIDTTSITIQEKEDYNDSYYQEDYLKIKILISENTDNKNKYRLKVEGKAMIDNNNQPSFNNILYFNVDDETQQLQTLGMEELSSKSYLLSKNNIRNNIFEISIRKDDITSIGYSTSESTVDSLDVQEKIHIRLENISEDYYKFLKSIEKVDNSGISPFVEPVPTYNNIKNGLGIFGSTTPNIDSTIVINFKVPNNTPYTENPSAPPVSSE